MKCNNCVKQGTMPSDASWKNILSMLHTQAIDAQQIAEVIRDLNSKWQVEVIPNTTESLVSVEGMRCNNCVNNITKNLLANEHISKVHVSLENQQADVLHTKEIGMEDIVGIITKLNSKWTVKPAEQSD